MNSFRLYYRYLAISIRGQMQYRASFLTQTLGTLAATGIEFLSIWALFHRFGTLHGWTLPEVALMYGMVNVAFSLTDAMSRGFDAFGRMVRTGDFDRLLLRPRSTVLQLAGQELTMRRIGRFSQGIVVLIWAMHQLQMSWSFLQIGLLVAATLGGACFFFGLIVLQATTAFWTVESLEMFNAFTYGGVYASQYPMTIYRGWFRRLMTYVIPLATVTYFPALAILGRPDPLGTRLLFQCLSPLIGVAFLLIAFQVWKIGVRHYCSTGS